MDFVSQMLNYQWILGDVIIQPSIKKDQNYD